MDPFNALIQSFGEHMVTAIGPRSLEQLFVRGHEGSGFADVEIVLQDKTWDAQIDAIAKIAEMRTMFIDELSFAYQFFESTEDVDDDVTDKHDDAQPAYSLA